MKWTREQAQALLEVSRWMRDPDPGRQVFRLWGGAGTGKTTLAQHLAETADGITLFGAYTGKAAHVMRRAGCSGASTIHSLIYHSRERSRSQLLELERGLGELMSELEQDGVEIDGHPRVEDLREMIRQERLAMARPAFSLNHDSPVRGASLVVIDEVSMVDERMGQDLLSFGTKVLVLGDPGQLPPVFGEGYFTREEPDILLTEIHRQARESPIIAMADRVRRGERLELGDYGTSRVVTRATPEEAMGADQLLVGRNRTRRSCNLRARTLLGIPGQDPVPGDRLVCLRNNHDKGLLNGSVWLLEDIGELGEDRSVLTVRPDEPGGLPVLVEAHMHHFQGRGEDLPWWMRKEAEEFDYGYAMTVHKSQGSQWPDIIVFDESFCFREHASRWLYTALTRAQERVTVVRM